MEFTWLCRKQDEEFPYNISIGTENESSGGCYGDGNYSLPSEDPTVNVTTEKMKENQSYLIVVIVRKDTRTANSSQTLEVVQGSPPSMEIR